MIPLPKQLQLGRLRDPCLLAVLVVAGCQPAGVPGEESSSGNTDSPEAIQEMESVAASGVIETPNGQLVVAEVEFSDDFPPGCAEGAATLGGCSQTIEGYQYVIVWLEAVGGAQDSEVGSGLFDASEEAYLITDDGSRIWRAGGGILRDRPFVSFTPPVSDGGYSMVWPKVIDLRR